MGDNHKIMSFRMLLLIATPKLVGKAAELLSVLDKYGALNRADSVDCSDPGVLALNYDGRFRVEMFYDADFDFKIASLVKIVDEKLEPNETGTLLMTMEDEYQVNLVPSKR